MSIDLPQTKLKLELDEWLDRVDYSYLNSEQYKPTQFALEFMNFTKLVNAENPSLQNTPPFHLEMLDKLANGGSKQANLCHRGAAKTTLYGEFLIPYIAMFNQLPGLDHVTGIIYVSDTMENGAKSLRKNLEHRYNNSAFMQEWLPEAKFTDAYIEFTNKDGISTGIRLFGAKTGIRGTKIFGRRPQMAILDDLISDDDAKSKTSMEAIYDTVFKGVFPALEPNNSKVIFNGTPFTKQDIIVQIVESGEWDVNVYPVCNKFPCDRSEFNGSWENRFTYDYVLDAYNSAKSIGRLPSFYQEYMLRINSEEERLVQDGDINWYGRKELLQTKYNFNFYITTDFATSAKQHADFSVISVWAYNANGDWFWVDGYCEKSTMDKNMDKLFEFVQEYNPISVGIENTGQQGGFLSLFRREMMNRNTWFNYAKHGNSEGIRPTSDKLSRFSLVVPLFKAGKMFFPIEMKDSTIMKEFMDQIKLVTANGIKGKDDCVDTISMLQYMKPWKPSASSTPRITGSVYEFEEQEDEPNGMSSYIV